MSGATAPEVDFPIAGHRPVASEAELREVFAGRGDRSPPIRLCGSGSRLHELPAPASTVELVSLAPMRRITRFEPADLTCSVEPGLPRADLDAALRAHRLRLPCAREPGTIGGAFAAGRRALPDAPGPLGSVGQRAVLLGIRGMLAEGRAFRAGARVVKSVAGFDLQKLFIGSRGRLFAVTELHLRLRPAPIAEVGFALAGLELDDALTRFSKLRHDEHPPAALRLTRRDGEAGFRIDGRFEGSARVVADRLRAHRLGENADEMSMERCGGGLERLTGLVPPSRIARLAELSECQALEVNGSGCFALWLAPAATDALLPRLAGDGITAELDCASAARRGRSTGSEPAVVALQRRLEAALDPRGILA